MILPHYLLAFLLAIGAVPTAFAVPVQRGPSRESVVHIGASKAFVRTVKRADECSQDPRALSGSESDGLRAKTSLPLCYNPSIDGGRSSSLPIVRTVIEARDKEARDKAGITHPPTKSLVVDGSHPNNGSDVLKILSEHGKQPSPENVYEVFWSYAVLWERDIRKSESLSDFLGTDNGRLYMDTDKLIGKVLPGFDRIELETMILMDLFVSSNLHDSTRPQQVMAKSGYVILTELRSYAKDIQSSHTVAEFANTHYSGRLFHWLDAALPRVSDYGETFLPGLVQEDINGSTAVEKATKRMLQIQDYIRSVVEATPPPAAKELKKMMDAAIHEVFQE
ncbi:hypothetical protein FB446DRAFT_794440 [Lentinula raphanica]|nr:hypothetical protein FB446DRAFT_794440 [Lentinula raphanica]